jgi:hypothetical protein
MKKTFNQMTKMVKLGLAACLLGCIGTSLMGCGDEATDDSSLSVNAFSATLGLGDTSSAYSCTKQMRNTLGRMETVDAYTHFLWESGDSAIVKPVGRYLVGVKAGQTKVVAHDMASRLSSDSLSITVE